MKQTSGAIILRQDDYETLIAYLKNNRYVTSLDVQNVQDLKAELRRAMLVSKESFPEDVIRLNSKIKIKDAGRNNVTELILVMPDEADLRQKRISVMAPVGTALIGFRKGQKVSWQVPAGKRTFHIVDVVNDAHTIAGS